MEVNVKPRTQAADIYRNTRATERYYCNFGLNPAYQDQLVGAGLEISGTDQAAVHCRTAGISFCGLPDTVSDIIRRRAHARPPTACPYTRSLRSRPYSFFKRWARLTACAEETYYPLPRSQANFLSVCLKDGVEIRRQVEIRDMLPIPASPENSHLVSSHTVSAAHLYPLLTRIIEPR
jgi:hypothetical protein